MPLCFGAFAEMNEELCKKCSYRQFGHLSKAYCDMRAWELITTQSISESDCFEVSMIGEKRFQTPESCPYKLEHLIT